MLAGVTGQDSLVADQSLDAARGRAAGIGPADDRGMGCMVAVSPPAVAGRLMRGDHAMQSCLLELGV